MEEQIQRVVSSPIPENEKNGQQHYTKATRDKEYHFYQLFED